MKFRILLAALIAVTVAGKDCGTDHTGCDDDCSAVTCTPYTDAVCVQDECSCEVSWEVDGVNVTAECEEGISFGIGGDLEAIEDELEDIEDELLDEDEDDIESDDKTKKVKFWKRKAKKAAWRKKMAAKKGGKQNKFALKKQRKEERRENLIKKWMEKGLEAKAEMFREKWANKDERKKGKFAMKRQNKKERQERKKAMTEEERQEWIAEKKAKRQGKFAKRKQWVERKMARKEARKELRESS